MANIDKIINIEHVLLQLESIYKFKYSFKDLIESERLLKEIGEITNIYFNTQGEYSTTLNEDERLNKLKEYRDRLRSEDIEFDVSKYYKFIRRVSQNLENKELLEKINALN